MERRGGTSYKNIYFFSLKREKKLNKWRAGELLIFPVRAELVARSDTLNMSISR